MRQTAINICRRLAENGFEALFAGGAVRDLLMGEEPQDIDIATNALPEDIADVFEKSYAIGKHFGVILIEEDGHHFEIATFRSDAGYSDGRRPDAVFYTDKKEDALRRDFTANALFWDPATDTIHDFVNGVKDIKDRILRFVGDADQRINEDFLRILRAVRFKNRLGFEYGPKMAESLEKHASLAGQISAERVKEELDKVLISPHRMAAIRDLEHFGILRVILPEVAKLRDIPDARRNRDVMEHTLNCLMFLPKDTDATLAWAVLLHDTGKATTLQREADRNHFRGHEIASEKIDLEICNRLRFSRFETDKIAWLARHHIPFYGALKMNRSHRLKFYDHPFFEDLIELCRADAMGDDENDELVKRIEIDYHDARERKLLPQFHPDLLGGDEIMELTGLPQGEQIGVIKHELREKQLTEEITTKEGAKIWVKSRWQTTDDS